MSEHPNRHPGMRGTWAEEGDTLIHRHTDRLRLVIKRVGSRNYGYVVTAPVDGGGRESMIGDETLYQKYKIYKVADPLQ